MSADNGVYVLVTSNGAGGQEYRAIHAQAIENIYEYDCEKMCYLDKPDSRSIESYFGSAVPINNRSDAEKAAIRLHDDIGWTEYGVCFIEEFAESTFDQLIGGSNFDY